ncbi:MAG TPA: lipid-A-disaccharide synthase [Gammaproteobacteria bacterium]|nr:lipid-A-disaccharide synthase [Gammaproteobacteria bacterium]
MKVGIVVGEVSGDNLAANLMRALRQRYPNLTFEGILGPALLKEGGQSLYPMERLSVMGLIEPLGRLPELFRIRRQLIQHFCNNPPDVFIGVDAPDFNLGLEKKLKAHGISTVHYVSPSVWAWRQGRIKGIKKAVGLMLTLFPFEAKFFEDHQVPVCFTGHPLADQIPLEVNTIEAKEALGLDMSKPVIALLPGSRQSEIKYLAEIFIKSAQLCFEKQKNLQFVMPLVSEAHKVILEHLHQMIAPEMPIKILLGDAHLAMRAADAVLVTSGTATLEVMLHKKPMILAYRMHPINFYIVKYLVKLSYIALPNLLAGEVIVPEFIQSDATPEKLSTALLQLLSPDFDRTSLVEKFKEIHLTLKKNASEVAARAISAIMT